MLALSSLSSVFCTGAVIMERLHTDSFDHTTSPLELHHRSTSVSRVAVVLAQVSMTSNNSLRFLEANALLRVNGS